MFSLEQTSNIILIIFFIDIVVCLFSIFKIQYIKNKFIEKSNKRSLKEKIKDARVQEKYKRTKNYGSSSLFKVLYISILMFNIFIIYEVYVKYNDPKNFYPLYTLLFSGLFFSRRKSKDVYLFWQAYLNGHPDNEANIVVIPLYAAEKIDKSLNFLGIANILFTVILTIVIFI